MNQTEIYDKYSWILTQLSCKYGQSHNWQDLYQEGFLALVKCYESFDKTKGDFEIYAKTCVRNRMLNVLKKKTPYLFEYCDRIIDEDILVWEYLPDFTDDEEMIFNLWSDGHSYKEICNKTGYNMSKVKRRICTILKKIREANAENLDGK